MQGKKIWLFAGFVFSYLIYLLALFRNFLKSIEVELTDYNFFLFSLFSFALMLVAGIVLLRSGRSGVVVGLSIGFIAFATFIIILSH